MSILSQVEWELRLWKVSNLLNFLFFPITESLQFAEEKKTLIFNVNKFWTLSFNQPRSKLLEIMLNMKCFPLWNEFSITFFIDANWQLSDVHNASIILTLFSWFRCTLKVVSRNKRCAKKQGICKMPQKAKLLWGIWVLLAWCFTSSNTFLWKCVQSQSWLALSIYDSCAAV